MNPIAYLNGEFVSPEQMMVPVTDTGFMMGVTIAEQLRTFQGKPFRIADHLDRLMGGLRLINLDLPIQEDQLVEVIHTVASHNGPLLDVHDDIGITVFVTPGPYRTYHPSGPFQPVLGVHSYALPFQFWNEKYTAGEKLSLSSVQQVSANSWPFALKCRSRMHYYLASLAARSHSPCCTPLLLDEEGFISETPVSNVVAYFEEHGFVTPPADSTLNGISLRHLQDIAGRLQIPFAGRPLSPADLKTAHAVFVTSTPFCLLPVSQLDNHTYDLRNATPLLHKVLDLWSNDVGVDILQQANRFASRVV
ncbi:MAG: aminotransferase class IV [Planctomycetales bacterium]|nr:aminotransferase class IV [Planctomycetales bacterium]